MPVVCSRPVSSNLTVITRYSRSPKQTGRPQTNLIRVGFRCVCLFRLMAYLLTWLTLITITTGMCLINGYEVVKGQFAPYKKETNEGNKLPLTCFPQKLKKVAVLF